MNFLASHWDNILTVFGAIVSCATVIVKVTPTSKDDFILDKVVSFFNYFSIIKTKNIT